MEKKLNSIFRNTNDWLKFAEAKAAALVALNGIAVFGILELLINDQLSKVIVFYLYGAIAQLILSTLISLASLVPSLEMPWLFKKISPTQSDNLLYFEHIANYSDETFLDALYLSCNEKAGNYPRYQKMLANQIVTNSVIARRKYKLFKASIWILVSAISTPIGAIILFEVK